MTKDDMEVMFRRWGFLPAARARHGDYDIYVADGFSRKPHSPLQKKFGFQPDEPDCYVTFWWATKNETLQTDGGFIQCKPDQVNQKLRAKAAIKHAIVSLESRQRNRKALNG